MKKLIKTSLIALLIIPCVALFAACDLFGGNNKNKGGNKSFEEGTYVLHNQQTNNATFLGDTAAATGRLNVLGNLSFTIDEEGVITALNNFNQFITWSSQSGVGLRFTLSGSSIILQEKPTGNGATWATWNKQTSIYETSDSANVNYTQTVTGQFDKNTGIVSLVLRYGRTSPDGFASRVFTFKKQQS
jgi:hypothetical protein